MTEVTTFDRTQKMLCVFWSGSQGTVFAIVQRKVNFRTSFQLVGVICLIQRSADLPHAAPTRVKTQCELGSQ